MPCWCAIGPVIRAVTALEPLLTPSRTVVIAFWYVVKGTSPLEFTQPNMTFGIFPEHGMQIPWHILSESCWTAETCKHNTMIFLYCLTRNSDLRGIKGMALSSNKTQNTACTSALPIYTGGSTDNDDARSSGNTWVMLPLRVVIWSILIMYCHPVQRDLGQLEHR